MGTMQNDLTEQVKKFSISDRILLVEEIWDTIAEENQSFELTDSQKREFDRRLELAQGNPCQGRSWDEIKAEFMKSRNRRWSSGSVPMPMRNPLRPTNGTLTSAQI